MDSSNVNVAQLQSGIAAEIRDCLKTHSRPLPMTIMAALAAVFAVLKPWDEREGAAHTAEAGTGKAWWTRAVAPAR